MIRFNELPDITPGKMLSFSEDLPVDDIILDSRKYHPLPNSAFIAISGDRHDGHRYIAQLHDKGVRQFIVEDDSIDIPDDVNVFYVENSIKAFQDIAAHIRSQHSLEVVGITGSNGKTIVKEWLSLLLESEYFLIKSPKSYNSQVGVPLSVWKIRPHHQLGIFEAGISRTGEMENLEKVIRPDIGIFTNIGPAHAAGFDSMEQKIREKVKLFKNCSTIIYCKDHQEVDRIMKEEPKMLVTWGVNDESIIRIMDSSFSRTSTIIDLLYTGKSFRFSIPFTDKASMENAMHCIAFMLFKNFDSAFIQEHIGQWLRMSMRMELKKGVNGCYLIDDSYSNDLASLEVALDFMNQQPLKKKKTLILSDILQSGMEDEKLYSLVSDILKARNIEKVIGVGPALMEFKHLFNSNEKAFYFGTEDFLKGNISDQFHEELILVKGARKFGFEKIVKQLQQKIHGTVLEINLDSLVHNLNFFRSKLKKETKMMVMVKALAYGSGSSEIAHLLQFHNVDYLGVAYTDEAVALRENGIHLPIMVMNPNSEDFEKIIKYELEAELFGIEILQDFLEFLEQTDQKSRIHLKIDTGMHRLGFEEKDLNELSKILVGAKDRLEVASMFSHMAASDSSDHTEFSHQQAKTFQDLSSKLRDKLDESPLMHLVNSAGILRYPEYHFDMVRLGIGLYGYDANGTSQGDLLPISTFQTTISQIKEIKAGETIGYGRVGKAENDLRIATIAVGYADGFRREFSNGALSVSVNGHRAPVIGNVCMDMTMIDITGLKASVGDHVIIFGTDPGIEELARVGNTIPYEILTNVSDRVKRIFYSE